MTLVQETSISAFSAFESQLKGLCLNEFPCGIGPWKENYGANRKQLEKEQTKTRFVVTMKDYGACHEKTETLEELIYAKKSPWILDYTWSKEAESLRNLAVKSPWLIDNQFVYQYFKTLRIIDKGVTELDESFLRFKNLEELSLSANQLRTVNSRNFPPKLKVLELCGNMISHLEDLCIAPPPLVHLGLGHNQLTMVDDYLTNQYWPSLLSLDLSHNNLADLMDIIRKLKTLPSLRNLVMNGNPLSLVPGYRGYTIDSLKKLDFLDDLAISADDKHIFKGLAKRKEYILDECKMALQVEMLKGIMMPEELKAPEDQPEFPVITRNYYVQFMFLKDVSAENKFYLSHPDNDDAQSSTLPQDEQTEGSVHSSLPGSAQQEPTTPRQDATEEDHSEIASISVMSQHTEPHDELDELPLAPIKSKSVQWSENLELNWVKVVTRDDLVAVRDFFHAGVEVAVMEDKILSYPAEQDGPATTPSGKDKGKKDDKQKDSKKDKNKKDRKQKSSSAKGGKTKKELPKKDEGKKKKKKGEPEIEMRHLPPEVTTLAKFHLSLSEFLEGEHEVCELFVKRMDGRDGAQTPTMSETSTTRKEKKDKKKQTADKKKETAKEPAKAAKSDKKDKGGDKGKSKTEEDDNQPPPPPPPLEVKIRVKVHSWRTAHECMKQMDGEEETHEEETAVETGAKK